MSGGREGSIRCRSRDRFSPSASRCSGGATRTGGLSLFSVARVEGEASVGGVGGGDGARRSGLAPSGSVGEAGVLTLDLMGFESPVGLERSGFLESPPLTTRGGRATAPVGLLSGVPAFELSPGEAIRGSRPLKTLERRSSSSSGAPGVRVAAPVLSGRPAVGKRIGGRAIAGRSGRWLADDPSGRVPTRAGSPPLIGSELYARRASVSSARSGRTVSSPIDLAGILVTARRYAGLTRCSWANSYARNAVKRSGVARR